MAVEQRTPPTAHARPTVVDTETTAVRTRKPVDGTGAVTGGILAGILAGVGWALAYCLWSLSAALGFWTPTMNVAATWWGEQALAGGAGVIAAGLLTHFLISAFWGGIFGVIGGARITTGAALFAGLAYGVLVWAFMSWVVLPGVNAVMFERTGLYEGWWFFFHLVYGGLLCLTPPLARATSKTRREPVVQEHVRV